MTDNLEKLKLLLQREKDLREAVKRLSEAQSDYISDLIHEISTPINVITGVVELMETTSLTGLQASYISTLKNEGQNLRLLVRKIQNILAEDYQQTQNDIAIVEDKKDRTAPISGKNMQEDSESQQSMQGN